MRCRRPSTSEGPRTGDWYISFKLTRVFHNLTFVRELRMPKQVRKPTLRIIPGTGMQTIAWAAHIQRPANPRPTKLGRQHRHPPEMHPDPHSEHDAA